MERDEWKNNSRRLFTRLVRTTLWDDFVFPAGGRAGRVLDTCFDRLTPVSAERLVDFCVCQVHAIFGYGTDYRRRWDVSHSFGEKAVGRYMQADRKRRYREDRWLGSFSLSREELAASVEDRSRHPFSRFVYPEYEETTKRRLLSTEAGYAVCGASTLLWTPFSPSCRRCAHAGRCRRRAEALYPELYRLRREAWTKRREVRP